MRILVVSHNVFSKTSNMGKTMLSYFSNWKSEDLAQLYIHSEVPTDTKCLNYYRMTDNEIAKSIFTRRSGHIYGINDIQVGRTSSRTDKGLTAEIYQRARKRTPFTYFTRNLIWSLGKWNTRDLWNWVDEFDPDAVFFASGDYAFTYRIALSIAKRKNVPLFICCLDDYYINVRNENKFGGRYVYKLFMSDVNKAMNYASCIFTISDKMKTDYSSLFSKPCYTLHTPSVYEKPLNIDKCSKRISYIGNLGYMRDEQLIAIGRALKKISGHGISYMLDIYSSEKRPEILSRLTQENGINFCGEIDAEKVKETMESSMILIHTESFDDVTRKAVAFSVSTKIADSLASGVCLLAYGPAEIASISYLVDNNAAFCITDEHNLEIELERILSDTGLRQYIIENALNLAEKNHTSAAVKNTLERYIQEYIEDWNKL